MLLGEAQPDENQEAEFWRLVGLLGPGGLRGDLNALEDELALRGAPAITAFEEELDRAVNAISPHDQQIDALKDSESGEELDLFTEVAHGAAVAAVAKGQAFWRAIVSNPKLIGQPLEISLADRMDSIIASAWQKATGTPWIPLALPEDSALELKASDYDYLLDPPRVWKFENQQQYLASLTENLTDYSPRQIQMFESTLVDEAMEIAKSSEQVSFEAAIRKVRPCQRAWPLRVEAGETDRLAAELQREGEAILEAIHSSYEYVSGLPWTRLGEPEPRARRRRTLPWLNVFSDHENNDAIPPEKRRALDTYGHRLRELCDEMAPFVLTGPHPWDFPDTPWSLWWDRSTGTASMLDCWIDIGPRLKPQCTVRRARDSLQTSVLVRDDLAAFDDHSPEQVAARHIALILDSVARTLKLEAAP